MWVPSIQGFTDPQDIQSETTERGGIGIPGASNSHLPQILVCTKKQHWPSAHLSERKLLNLLLLSHYKGSTNLFLRSDKGKGGLGASGRYKFFFLVCPIENHSSFQVGLCTSSLWAQTQEEMNPCHNSFKKRWCCKNAHFKNQLYRIPSSFWELEAPAPAHSCVIVTSEPSLPHLPSFHHQHIPASPELPSTLNITFCLQASHMYLFTNINYFFFCC